MHLSDAQDGLKRWRMGFIFCGKHYLLLTRIQVSDRGPMGPLVFIEIGNKIFLLWRLSELIGQLSDIGKWVCTVYCLTTLV